ENSHGFKRGDDSEDFCKRRIRTDLRGVAREFSRVEAAKSKINHRLRRASRDGRERKGIVDSLDKCILPPRPTMVARAPIPPLQRDIPPP
ncbi:unnamed protein product, partial [Dovyalis caffra]